MTEQPRPFRHAWAALCLVSLALVGCAVQERPSAPERHRAPAWRAESWPEASALFRSDPSWLGGDGAFSVALDDARVLWLFGDSFVMPAPGPAVRDRRSSVMVRNSIAVQHGLDPSEARLAFAVPRDTTGAPQAFYEGSDEAWFWPGHGALVHGALVLFWHRMVADASAAPLGFRPSGWSAVRIAHPQLSPAEWTLEPLDTPSLAGDFGLVGVAVLVEDAQAYVFTVRDPGDRALCLLRVSSEALARGDWSDLATWSGAARGFVPGAPCTPLAAPVATELSITRDPTGQGYVWVESEGFGLAPITVRRAPSITGPWSAPEVVYRPAEAPGAVPGTTLVYAAKAHPEQHGAELVITYAVNSLDAARLYDDLELYFPRVLKLDRRESVRAHAR